MCGIVGAIAERDVVPVLLEGLRRLEYRGYDSAGIAVLDLEGRLERVRALGKVRELEGLLAAHPLHGARGIAHTRWATHGAPHERNAHPHFSGQDIGIIHNGIIENHAPIRQRLFELGYAFESETDTEVIAHLIHHERKSEPSLLAAVQAAVAELTGAFALSVISRRDPDCLVVARCGCPAVIGLGIGENFVASDIAALLPVTRRFIFLEEGDVAEIRRETVQIYDRHREPTERPVRESELSADAANRGGYRHYMLKEIFEQPRAVAETLEERIAKGCVLEPAFGYEAACVFAATRAVQIVACGTSYHAGLVARYLIEQLAGLPCQVEVASEYRYRTPAVMPGTLFVTVSQSGETADTLAALRMARELDYCGTLSICNVPESSLVRESALVLMTRAGMEIGVASTKAFTTQVTALMLLTTLLARHRGLSSAHEAELTAELMSLPERIEQTLTLNGEIEAMAEYFGDKHHALFLGRGVHFPVALEGALKLKEISYIHAEAYPAGELKHGPLALVDADMPVIAVAPNNESLEKLKSNLHEVRARGGELIVFADEHSGFTARNGLRLINLPAQTGKLADPIIYTIPLQLLAYHVAVLKGTDVDQPRNLAKSVTVE
jgi:glucosamine--fructose-6-phosphate aminotransferase (isomerizing)